MSTIFETSDGRTLSYHRRGMGPMLVCVPGGPGLDPEAYYAPLDLPGHEILVFAPRGTGQSSAPSSPEHYRFADFVADLEDLRLALDVERLTLYGQSHGGSVVLAYARAHPDRVARLIIGNGCALVDDSFHEAQVQAKQALTDSSPDAASRVAAADAVEKLDEAMLNEAERQRAFRTWFSCCVAREGPVERSYLDRLCAAPRNDVAAETMWAEWLEGINLLEGADAVSAPVLVVSGQYDVAVPAAATRLIAAALPNARYLEFADTGHLPFVETSASTLFRAAVCEFLA